MVSEHIVEGGNEFIRVSHLDRVKIVIESGSPDDVQGNSRGVLEHVHRSWLHRRIRHQFRKHVAELKIKQDLVSEMRGSSGTATESSTSIALSRNSEYIALMWAGPNDGFCESPQ